MYMCVCVCACEFFTCTAVLPSKGHLAYTSMVTYLRGHPFAKIQAASCIMQPRAPYLWHRKGGALRHRTNPIHHELVECHQVDNVDAISWNVQGFDLAASGTCFNTGCFRLSAAYGTKVSPEVFQLQLVSKRIFGGFLCHCYCFFGEFLLDVFWIIHVFLLLDLLDYQGFFTGCSLDLLILTGVFFAPVGNDQRHVTITSPTHPGCKDWKA